MSWNAQISALGLEPNGYQSYVLDRTYIRSVYTVLKCSRLMFLCISGLAGVYDINVHYSYETWRGVEDISTMARAMYGPKQFDRFSPTVIIPTLPPRTRFVMCFNDISELDFWDKINDVVYSVF